MNAVETNVFVYRVDEDEPRKQSKAGDLLRRLVLKPSETVLLWQVAGEFLACLRKWQAAGSISAEDVAAGSPTAGGVTCRETAPSGEVQMASLSPPVPGLHAQSGATQIGSEDTTPMRLPAGLHYTRFTSQEALGKFLVQHYDIRNPRELTSCEVCHR